MTTGGEGETGLHHDYVTASYGWGLRHTMGCRCNYLSSGMYGKGFSRALLEEMCALQGFGDVPCAWWALQDARVTEKKEMCVFVFEMCVYFFLTKNTSYILRSCFTNQPFKEGRI